MYLDFYKQHEWVQFDRLRVVTGRKMATRNQMGQIPSPRHSRAPCLAAPLRLLSIPRTCLACHGVLGAESSPFFQTVLHRAVLVKSHPFPLPERILWRTRTGMEGRRDSFSQRRWLSGEGGLCVSGQTCLV